MKSTETHAVTYELEVAIDAGVDEVWRALVERTDAWWLPDFHMVAAGSNVRLDARAGGGLVETDPEGGSLLWYTVQMVVPGRSLHLVGHLAADYGGPATTMLKLALEERDGGTVLSVQDSLVGRVSEDTAASLRAGWEQLFGEGLKAFVEGA